MILGFTGTRRGMSDAQLVALHDLLLCSLRPAAFRHGDCIGADEQAAVMVRRLFPSCRVVCHPPVDETHRAFTDCNCEVLPAKTHFARNRDIVDNSDVLVAAPFEAERQPRGGTWYTSDYARKRKLRQYVIWPDGSITSE